MAEQYNGNVDKQSIMSLDWGGSATNDALSGKQIQEGLKDFLRHIPTYSVIVGKNIYMFASEEDYNAWVADGSKTDDSRIVSKSPAIKTSDLIKSGTLEAQWTPFTSKVISGDTCNLSGLKFIARTYDANDVLVENTSKSVSYKVTVNSGGSDEIVVSSTINAGTTVRNINLSKYLVSNEAVTFTISASFEENGMDIKYSSEPIELIKSSVSLAFSDDIFWKERVTRSKEYNINFTAQGAGTLLAHINLYEIGKTTPLYSFPSSNDERDAIKFIGGTNKVNTFTLTGTDTQTIDEGIYRLEAYITTEVGGEVISTSPISKNIMVVTENSTTPLICANLSNTLLTNYTSSEILQFIYNGTIQEVEAQVAASYGAGTYYTNKTVINLSGQNQLYTYSTTVALSISSGGAPLAGRAVISGGGKSYSYDVTIANEYSFSPTTGYRFDFDPTAQNSQADIYDNYLTNTIPTVWSGITWSSSEGYITNSEGNTVLKLFADSSACIKKSLFADPSKGMTFEIMYRVTNTLDSETPVIYSYNTVGKDYKGLKIYSENIDFRPASTSDEDAVNGNLRVCDGEVIHLVITYYPNYSGWGFPLTKIFINGKIAREINGTMASVVGNNTNTEGYLNIGSEAADLEIYRIRFYENNLDDDQVLDNYYNVTLDTDKRVADYTRNQIFADGEIQFNKIFQKGIDAAGNKRALFNCIVFSGWDEYDDGVKEYCFPSDGSTTLEEFQQKRIYDARMDDTNSAVAEYLKDKQCVLPGFSNGNADFKCKKARIEIYWDNDQYAQNKDIVLEIDPSAEEGSSAALKYQGSSSTNYFRYNWRTKFEKGSFIYDANEYNGQMTAEEKAAIADTSGKLTWYQNQEIVTDADGNITIQGKDPVKFGVLTGKKNAASSMQTHKAGFDNAYNALYKRYMGDDASHIIKNNAHCRVATYSAPFLGFVKIPADKTNPDAGYLYKFVGLYTAGPDKGDKTTTGFDNKLYTDIYEIEGAEQAPRFTNFICPWNDERLKNTVSALGELITNTTEDPTVSEEQWEVIKYPLEIKKKVDLDEEKATDAELATCRTTQLAYFKKHVKPMYDFVWEHSINILPYEGTVEELQTGKYPSQFTLGEYYKEINGSNDIPTNVDGKGEKTNLNQYMMYWSVKDPSHTLYYKDGLAGMYIPAVETDDAGNRKDPTTVHTEYLQARHQSYTKAVVTPAVLYTYAEFIAIPGNEEVTEETFEALSNEDKIKNPEVTKLYWQVVEMPSFSDSEQAMITTAVKDILKDSDPKYAGVLSDELEAELSALAKTYATGASKMTEEMLDACGIDFASRGNYVQVNIVSDAAHEPQLNDETDTWQVYDIALESYVDTGIKASYYSRSLLAENEYAKINERIRDIRATDFKANWETYFNAKDFLLWYTDVILNAGTDERAKNTYWYKLGNVKLKKDGKDPETGKDIYVTDEAYVPDNKWRMRMDDTDTRFDVDNTGLCINKYWIEPGDCSNLSGQTWSTNSAFFNLLGHKVFTEPKEMATYDYFNVQGAFRYRFQAMAEIATGGNTCTSPAVLAFYDKYLFNIADYFPQQAYNQDAVFAYDQAKRWISVGTPSHVLSTGTDPITQSLGDHKLGDRGFIKNRIIYYMSKYALGDFNKAQGGSAVVYPRGINYGGISEDVTFNRWMYYVTYAGEKSIPQGNRIKVNETVTFPNFLRLDEADSGLYGASFVSDLGDWSQMVWKGTEGAAVPFYNFDHLRDLKLGNDGTVGFNRSVAFQDSTNKSGMSALRTLNLHNCTSIRGIHDLTVSSHLKEIDAIGSNVAGFKLANGVSIERFYLPYTATVIALNNTRQLEDFKIDRVYNTSSTAEKQTTYKKLEQLLVRNVPTTAVDGLQMLIDIFKIKDSGQDISLRNIWVEGFNNTFDQTNVQSNLDTLLHIADKNDDGTSVFAGFDGTSFDANNGYPTLKGTIKISANYRQNDINNIKKALANPLDLNVEITDPARYSAIADFNDTILQAAIYNYVSVGQTEVEQANARTYYNDMLPVFTQFQNLTKDPNKHHLVYKLLSAQNINTWLNIVAEDTTPWKGTVTAGLQVDKAGRAVQISTDNIRDLSDWGTWFPNTYPTFLAINKGHKIPVAENVPVNLEYNQTNSSINLVSFVANDNTGNYGLGTVTINADAGLTLSANSTSAQTNAQNDGKLNINNLITKINGSFVINKIFRSAKINNWYINTPGASKAPKLTDEGYWNHITNIYINQNLYWNYLTDSAWSGRLTSAGMNFIPYNFDKKAVTEIPKNTVFDYDSAAVLFNQTAVKCTEFTLNGYSIVEIKFNTCVYQSSNNHNCYIFGNAGCYLWINSNGNIELRVLKTDGSYNTVTGPSIEDLGPDENITVRFNLANLELSVNNIVYRFSGNIGTLNNVALSQPVALGTRNNIVNPDTSKEDPYWKPDPTIFIGHVFYVIAWTSDAVQDYQYNFLTPGRTVNDSGITTSVYLAETDSQHRFDKVPQSARTQTYYASVGDLTFVDSRNIISTYSY